MSSTALAVRGIDDVQRIAKAYAMSGYWPEARDVAQAFVKVSFGVEVGLPAYVAMSEVHIIQGKPTLGAGALAGLVKAHPDYDYRIVRHDTDECVIKFFQHGEAVGESRFTMDDARTAGLTSNQTWKKYPRNMLFARAIANGVAWYAPDVTMGRVYTPDEMDAVVDGEVVGEGSGLGGSPSVPAADTPWSATSPDDGGPGAVGAPVEAADDLPSASAAEPADIALWQHADRLTEQLVELTVAFGADPMVAAQHAKRNRSGHEDAPEEHVAWLERQIATVQKNVDERDNGPAFEDPLAKKRRQIHAAARKAGLDDDARHALLERVTGQPSTNGVRADQVQAVLDAIAQVQT